MKLLRRLHLYLGVFFAPLLLLFALTGGWQALGTRTGTRPGPNWIEKLETIHREQYYPLAGPHTYAPHAFQLLAAVMAAALAIMLVIGLLLAFKETAPQRRKLVWFALIAGIALPALLLVLSAKARPHIAPHPGLHPLSAAETGL